jgi:hypothetical protein
MKLAKAAMYLLTCLLLLGHVAHAQGEAGDEEEGSVKAFAFGKAAELLPKEYKLLDTPHIALTAKNISQINEDGNTQFGVGLDYHFGYDWSLSTPIAMDLGVKGTGFVSLNDPNGDGGNARLVSNFNSIVNEGHIRLPPQAIIHGPKKRVSIPMPTCPKAAEGESEEQTADRKAACRALGDLWREDVRAEKQKILLHDATHWTAFDASLRGRSESDQGFNDTQGAIGLNATVASGFATNFLLGWAKSAVPADPYEPEVYGRIFQSPALFLGFDYVIGADQRPDLDGTSKADFPRLNLELSWTTELFFSGLWPYINYVYLYEISAPLEIQAVGKQSSHFVEVGASYYVAGLVDRLRDTGPIGGAAARVTKGRGPFVTIKYAYGELPPYLVRDEQVSLGVGFSF